MPDKFETDKTVQNVHNAKIHEQNQISPAF